MPDTATRRAATAADRPPRVAWGLRLAWFTTLGAVLLVCERAPLGADRIVPNARRELAFVGLLCAMAALGALVVWPALAARLKGVRDSRTAWAFAARELTVLSALAGPWLVLSWRWSGIPASEAVTLVAYVIVVLAAAGAWAVADASRFGGRLARPALAVSIALVAGAPLTHFAFFEFAGRGFVEWSAASPVWWLVRAHDHAGSLVDPPELTAAFAWAGAVLVLGLIAARAPRRWGAPAEAGA